MDKATTGSRKRIPGKVKSKVASEDHQRQLLNLAYNIITNAVDRSISNKYYKLKYKLMMCQPNMKTPSCGNTPPRMSEVNKSLKKQKNITTVKKRDWLQTVKTDREADSQEMLRSRSKSTNIRHGKTSGTEKSRYLDSSRRKDAITAICHQVCYDLSNLRDKVLRRYYSRKTLKQINPKLRYTVSKAYPYLNQELRSRLGSVDIAFYRLCVALDVQSMKVKEYLARKGPQPSHYIDRMKKDNAWLLDKVEYLLNYNYQLRSQSLAADVTKACDEVKRYISSDNPNK